ncbi:hypothetical protein EIN_057010 [Entamoeba invadens IP1]|uniref:hypothetical protein n=1 Tax=Entamoeba invadens IP1 TaxID=370355 RepID=UPI0002C3E862|nr:hypothetical protein EIN_057010 [Entamoeba invadens IP1]ELP93316.1 hypothetical protein EIN_057010 [Entamoeba invadens IP1]|eukprot:XP_004260087.1 hypothetical protein EIN_057010 [Entamoeba invadens IP1]
MPKKGLDKKLDNEGSMEEDVSENSENIEPVQVKTEGPLNDLEAALEKAEKNRTVVQLPKEVTVTKDEKKELEEKMLLRQLFLSKEHKDVAEINNDKEKDLRQFAVKGVLQLFNAISEHQLKLRIQKQKESNKDKQVDDLIDETLSKDDFLTKLVGGQQQEKEELKKKTEKTSKMISKQRYEKSKKVREQVKEDKIQKEEERKKAKYSRRAERKRDELKQESDSLKNPTKKIKFQKKPKKATD